MASVISRGSHAWAGDHWRPTATFAVELVTLSGESSLHGQGFDGAGCPETSGLI